MKTKAAKIQRKRTGDHTPGPWTIGNRYGNLHTEIAGKGYGRAIAFVWTHQQNARLSGEQPTFSVDPEGEANLHVLAAADDLLQAAIEVLDFHERTMKTPAFPGTCLHRLALAVGKATAPVIPF